MARKTSYFKRMFWIGLALTLVAGMNAALVPGHWVNWVTLASGVGLVIISLVAKKTGRT